jgi:hypothetical protein
LSHPNPGDPSPGRTNPHQHHTTNHARQHQSTHHHVTQPATAQRPVPHRDPLSHQVTMPIMPWTVT